MIGLIGWFAAKTKMTVYLLQTWLIQFWFILPTQVWLTWDGEPWPQSLSGVIWTYASMKCRWFVWKAWQRPLYSAILGSKFAQLVVVDQIGCPLWTPLSFFSKSASLLWYTGTTLMVSWPLRVAFRGKKNKTELDETLLINIRNNRPLKKYSHHTRKNWG